MKVFQKILVPTDFSDYAKNALNVAADLARRYEASVAVLHVWEPDLFSVPGSNQLFDPSQQPLMIAKLNKLLEDTRGDLKATGVTQVDTALAQGAPTKEIVDFALAGAFDLIVMGTHGRSGLAHVLLGSVAERIVQKAHCAVLTVRGPKSAQ
jgi:universal stress protein A